MKEEQNKLRLEQPAISTSISSSLSFSFAGRCQRSNVLQENMPTTEIISVGAGVGPHTPKLKRFAQRCDCRLESDRGSFQAVLDSMEGTMIHLGDYSDTPNDPCWFCGHVTIHPNPDDRHHIQYESTAFEELLILLAVMQEQSPTRHVIFLTDYQFGPDEFKIEHLNGIADFSALNAAGRIRFNTLYHIQQKQEAEQAMDGNPH